MGKLLAAVLLIAPAFADDLTRIQVHVVNPGNHPIDQASVIVKFVEGRSKVKFGAKIRQEWDLKTSQEGMVKIPPIPKGKILIQVNASNYQTYGKTIDIQEDEKTVEVTLNSPQKQYSAHDKEKDK